MAELFGFADFTVFIAMLILSFGIGIFFSIRDRKKNSTNNYYFGNGHMSIIPVALSTCVSLISSVTVIGWPVETYKYGAVVVWIPLQTVLACAVASIYFIPILRRVRLKSVYEILENRYNRNVRILSSVIQVVFVMTKMGVIIYLPSLALSAVTPMNLYWVIAATTLICTAYTALGGIKAVIWTDVFQSFVMFFGSLALFIKVATLIKDENPIQTLKESGRWNLFDFSADPTRRLAFWNLSGMVVKIMFTFCCHQAHVQRHLACKSTRDAQISLMISAIPQTFLLVLSALVGCVTFLYYKNCDPVLSGKIDTYDQAIPYLALEVFVNYPGMAGLFVSAAFGGSLSTLSSGISAVSVIILEDFVLPVTEKRKAKISNLTLSRIITCILGVLIISIAYLCIELGSAVLRFYLTIHGVLSGVMLGAFVLALFVPWSNWKGVVFGQLISLSFAIFLSLGSILNKNQIQTNKILPLMSQHCGNKSLELVPSSNILSTTNMEYVQSSTIQEPPSTLVTHWFSLSHYLYGPIVLLLTLGFGIIISFATGPEDPSKADPELFVPLFDNNMFPQKLVKFFRFGVPPRKNTNDEERIQLNTNEKNIKF